MTVIDVLDAQADLPQLLDRVLAGEEVMLAKGGMPVARIASIEAGKPQRRLGMLEGKVVTTPDFDDPLPDHILAGFEGR